MKRIILVIAVIGFAATTQKAAAQVRVSVNLNIGVQPEWGPAGYDYVDYYFLPDIDVYYYVPQRRFIYFSSGRWVFVSSLPARYGYYNLYNSYKVVINEPKPYLRHEIYRIKYAKYKGWYGKQPNNKNNIKYKSYRGGGNSKPGNKGPINKGQGNKGQGNKGHGKN